MSESGWITTTCLRCGGWFRQREGLNHTVCPACLLAERMADDRRDPRPGGERGHDDGRE
jgi:hypothetical protein